MELRVYWKYCEFLFQNRIQLTLSFRLTTFWSSLVDFGALGSSCVILSGFDKCSDIPHISTDGLKLLAHQGPYFAFCTRCFHLYLWLWTSTVSLLYSPLMLSCYHLPKLNLFIIKLPLQPVNMDLGQICFWAFFLSSLMKKKKKKIRNGCKS